MTRLLDLVMFGNIAMKYICNIFLSFFYNALIRMILYSVVIYNIVYICMYV